MSATELTRVEVLARVKAGGLSVKSAAVLLHVSYPQAKRLVRRFVSDPQLAMSSLAGRDLQSLHGDGITRRVPTLEALAKSTCRPKCPHGIKEPPTSWKTDPRPRIGKRCLNFLDLHRRWYRYTRAAPTTGNP